MSQPPMPAGEGEPVSGHTRSGGAFRGLVLLAVVAVLALLLAKPGLRWYDGWRLASFTRRIAATDRIVGTFAQSPVVVPFTGDEVRKVVSAVEGAKSARLPSGQDWACSFMAKATFLQGTNTLGTVWMCNSLFLIDPRRPP